MLLSNEVNKCPSLVVMKASAIMVNLANYTPNYKLVLL